jgi:cytochrome c oxidase cbb3-type subunit 3
MAHKEIDHISGTETTGHSWDGDLKELNTPLPSWWLWVFWITVIWSIGYYVVYPSWPTPGGYLQGMFGWSSRGDLENAVTAANAAMAPKFTQLEKASLQEINGNADLSAFAAKAGKAVYGDNCTACHGTGADGVRPGSGYPNLTDGDWLWGGKLEDIIKTITVGVRSGNANERTNVMAAYGDQNMLDAGQIKNVAGYVLSLSGGSLEGADVAAGKQVFADNCVACHGPEGKGNVAEAPGAPNLTDNIWLFGQDKVVETITHGRGGVMPSWEGRLTPAQIKAAAVYVYSRGGGQ